MSSGKKKLVIFFLLFLVLAIPATVFVVLQQQQLQSQAEPATTLAFDPASTTKNVGETFTLNIGINTGTNSVSGAELHIQYDPQKLQAISIDNAPIPFLPVVLVDGSVANGFAFITLGSQPSQPKKGSGTLATITFRAFASTEGAPTFVRFLNDTTRITRVAGSTGDVTEPGNLLASQPAPASITINALGPTATPTVNPSPTGGLPTPTPRDGVSGPRPTATPTGRIGIGATTPTTHIVLTATPAQKGGPISPGPTTADVPVTADIAPTTLLTIGGAILTVVGAISLLAF